MSTVYGQGPSLVLYSQPVVISGGEIPLRPDFLLSSRSLGTWGNERSHGCNDALAPSFDHSIFDLYLVGHNCRYTAHICVYPKMYL